MKLISDKSQELIKGDNCFDIIRYYLSFIVVFAHFSILSGANNFNWITSSGEAVSGFFILSGFLVYYSFMKKPQLNDYIKKTGSAHIATIHIHCFLMLYWRIVFVDNDSF